MLRAWQNESTLIYETWPRPQSCCRRNVPSFCRSLICVYVVGWAMGLISFNPNAPTFVVWSDRLSKVQNYTPTLPDIGGQWPHWLQNYELHGVWWYLMLSGQLSQDGPKLHLTLSLTSKLSAGHSSEFQNYTIITSQRPTSNFPQMKSHSKFDIW